MAATQHAGAGAASSPFTYRVCLNPLDCNLDMVLGPDYLSAHTLSEGACGYCWSGARANLGIFARGKFFFRVTLGQPCQVNVTDSVTLSTGYSLRVGVSRFQPAVEQLGEVPFSWALCSTGSKASLPTKKRKTTNTNTTTTPANGASTAAPAPTPATAAAAGAINANTTNNSGSSNPGGSATPVVAAAAAAAAFGGTEEEYVSYPLFETGVVPPLRPGDTVTVALDLSGTDPGPEEEAAAAAAAAGGGGAVRGAAGGAAGAERDKGEEGKGKAAAAAGSGKAGAGKAAVGWLWAAVNGGELVRLFALPLPNHATQSYFPHLLLRNLGATADFTGEAAQPPPAAARNPARQQQPPLQQPPPQPPLPPGLLQRGFRAWQSVPLLTADCVSTMPAGALPAPSACEVLVLTGLPGSGKSTWAQRHSAEHPAKRFYVLGPSLVLEQMRLLCPRTRRLHYPGQPEELFAVLADALARQAQRAPGVPRNYILDRTHVTPASRRAAVAPFRSAGFRCVSVVAAVAEAQLFAQQKEAFEREGKVVPDEVMAQLRASFTLPNVDEGFDDVQYPALGLMKAMAGVNRQRKEARAWLQYFQPDKQRQRRLQGLNGDAEQPSPEPPGGEAGGTADMEVEAASHVPVQTQAQAQAPAPAAHAGTSTDGGNGPSTAPQSASQPPVAAAGFAPAGVATTTPSTVAAQGISGTACALSASGMEPVVHAAAHPPGAVHNPRPVAVIGNERRSAGGGGGDGSGGSSKEGPLPPPLPPGTEPPRLPAEAAPNPPYVVPALQPSYSGEHGRTVLPQAQPQNQLQPPHEQRGQGQSQGLPRTSSMPSKGLLFPPLDQPQPQFQQQLQPPPQQQPPQLQSGQWLHQPEFSNQGGQMQTPPLQPQLQLQQGQGLGQGHDQGQGHTRMPPVFQHPQQTQVPFQQQLMQGQGSGQQIPSRCFSGDDRGPAAFFPLPPAGLGGMGSLGPGGPGMGGFMPGPGLGQVPSGMLPTGAMMQPVMQQAQMGHAMMPHGMGGMGPGVFGGPQGMGGMCGPGMGMVMGVGMGTHGGMINGGMPPLGGGIRIGDMGGAGMAMGIGGGMGGMGGGMGAEMGPQGANPVNLSMHMLQRQGF